MMHGQKNIKLETTYLSAVYGWKSTVQVGKRREGGKSFTAAHVTCRVFSLHYNGKIYQRFVEGSP